MMRCNVPDGARLATDDYGMRNYNGIAKAHALQQRAVYYSGGGKGKLVAFGKIVNGINFCRVKAGFFKKLFMPLFWPKAAQQLAAHYFNRYARQNGFCRGANAHKHIYAGLGNTRRYTAGHVAVGN